MREKRERERDRDRDRVSHILTPSKHIFRWKWSIKQPIIAGKKKRSTENQIEEIENILKETFDKIVNLVEERERKMKTIYLDENVTKG